MGEQGEQGHDRVATVTARNVAGMRELLAQKQRQHDRRGTEPPLEDSANIAAQQDQLAEDSSGSNGNTGGSRNMGGGRS